MNIEYRIKNTFGTDRKYPVSNDALLVCALTGLKTLTELDIETIKKFYPNSTFKQVL